MKQINDMFSLIENNEIKDGSVIVYKTDGLPDWRFYW